MLVTCLWGGSAVCVSDIPSAGPEEVSHSLPSSSAAYTDEGTPSPRAVPKPVVVLSLLKVMLPDN